MSKPKDDYAIQTVTNALRALEAFRGEDEIGVTQLARQLGLHKNNVFRILATLQLKGYVEQAANERYRLGAATFEVGQCFARSRSLFGKVRPILAELARGTGETVHLALLRGFQVVHVDGAATGRLVGAALRVGALLPVHGTALGKVLLAHAPDGEREAFDREVVVAGGGLPRRTPRTITDGLKFFEELRTVVADGVALDVEECEPGLCCVAAPVFDASGGIAAAISVSGPAFRLGGSERLRTEVGPRVAEAASGFSRELGYPA